MRFQRLMWKVLLSVLILEPAVARKTEMPPSFHFTSIQKSNVPHFTPSKVDISAIKTKHELAEARGEAPRYAAPIDVAITPKTDGVWTSLGKDTLL